MNAQDLLWTLAEAENLIPLGDMFSELPEPSRSWLRTWARTPLEPCEHGGTLWALGGYRAARCWSCATTTGLSELVRHCGRCGSLAGDGSTYAVFTLGPDVLGLATICGTCMRRERE